MGQWYGCMDQCGNNRIIHIFSTGKTFCTRYDEISASFCLVWTTKIVIRWTLEIQRCINSVVHSNSSTVAAVLIRYYIQREYGVTYTTLYNSDIITIGAWSGSVFWLHCMSAYQICNAVTRWLTFVLPWTEIIFFALNGFNGRYTSTSTACIWLYWGSTWNCVNFQIMTLN